MLAGAVDARVGLLVQQAHHAVPVGNQLHVLHNQQVLIHRHIGRGEDGRQLVLGGRDLVMLRLGVDAQPPECVIQLRHERRHLGLEWSEVVVVHLLPLGRGCPEQRPAAVDQILASVEIVFVDKEIFLLCADRGRHARRVGVAEQPQDAQSLLGQRVHGAQKRRFGIQRLAGIGAEGGGDIEGIALDERIGRRVPRGIAPRLKGSAQTAGREGGGIRFALDELLSGKLHDHLIALERRDKCVMLLGCDACQRLEPVRIVRGALFDRPILHGIGDRVRDGCVDGFAGGDGAGQGLIDFLWQAASHCLVVEHHASVQLVHVIFRHTGSPYFLALGFLLVVGLVFL